jgi:hypothetical protein
MIMWLISTTRMPSSGLKFASIGRQLRRAVWFPAAG